MAPLILQRLRKSRTKIKTFMTTANTHRAQIAIDAHKQNDKEAERKYHIRIQPNCKL